MTTLINCHNVFFFTNKKRQTKGRKLECSEIFSTGNIVICQGASAISFLFQSVVVFAIATFWSCSRNLNAHNFLLTAQSRRFSITWKIKHQRVNTVKVYSWNEHCFSFGCPKKTVSPKNNSLVKPIFEFLNENSLLCTSNISLF